MSEEAKNAVDFLPYKVDFSNNEACTGSAATVPEYRSKGLEGYGCFKRLQFLGENGKIICRNAIEKRNIAAQKATARFSPRLYAEARYLQLLWWRFWKEKPLAQAASHH
jgi:hypothetical protein